MCRAAAETLAEQVTPDDLEAGSFYPSIRDLRHVSVRIAGAVVREARDSGVGRDLPDQAILEAVAAMRWDPDY
jgi:malic enzyme